MNTHEDYENPVQRYIKPPHPIERYIKTLFPDYPDTYFQYSVASDGTMEIDLCSHFYLRDQRIRQAPLPYKLVWKTIRVSFEETANEQLS